LTAASPGRRGSFAPNIAARQADIPQVPIAELRDELPVVHALPPEAPQPQHVC
jgi:hypothetical protein